ncbi:hypothetical protein [Streptomyces sp. NPDC054961]
MGDPVDDSLGPVPKGGANQTAGLEQGALVETLRRFLEVWGTAYPAAVIWAM